MLGGICFFWVRLSYAHLRRNKSDEDDNNIYKDSNKKMKRVFVEDF